MKIDTPTLRQPLSPLRWALLLLLPALLPGCEHQTAYSMMVPWSADEPPRIWYWETRETAPVIGSKLCELLEQDTGEKVFTCRVPVLQGSDENPVVLAVGEVFEARRWEFPADWTPPGWPFQLEYPGNTVGDIHLGRSEDMYQQVVPLNEIEWRLAWDADDPPPLEAWVVFRVATSAGGDPLEVAMYYDGTLEQPWREAGDEGELTSRCAGQRSGGGTSEVPCYLPAPPPGEAYQVDVWLRGANVAVETISFSRTELVGNSATRVRCPGITDGPYTLYYPDNDGDGDGDPTGAAVGACGALDGYAPNSNDCPGEECETPPLPSEVDLDQDGFSPAHGDCNDYDPLIYPGAADPPDDGIDQDCGGLDGPQPHVGLNERSAASIQVALDAAPDDPAVTVWVGPGIYYEYFVTFRGKSLRLKSTDGQEKTIIDAQQRGTVMVFDSGETEETVSEGFTIRGGGSVSNGGGIYLYVSSPTLTNVTLTGNTATVCGGGMFLYSSSPTLTNVTLTGNTATFDEGGGMYLDYSSPTLTNVTLTGNQASSGGGMFLYSSSPVLTNVTLTGNETDYGGGGMFLDYSSPVLINVTLTGNRAEWGGGMYLASSSPTLTNVTLTGNEATSGGGMHLSSSSPTLTNITLTGNSATDCGGGMYLSSSSPTLRNCILAYNTGLNLTVDMDNSQPVLSYTNLYNPYGASQNLPVLPSTVTELDPGFVAFSSDGDASNDDLHLRTSSPLIDAGDPSGCGSSDSSGCDPDGSLPDLGALGGTGADFNYYADSDADTLYDGYELAQAGDLATLDGNTDTDGDGLSDKGELEAGTNLTTADSDGDGFSDGQEVSDGRDPLNPSSVPGVEGLVRLEVPTSLYPTVQSALNAIPTGGYGVVRLAPGTYRENLILSQKRVVLEGAGEGLTVLDGMQTGSVIRADTATLELSGVTVRNGKDDSGGGIYLTFAAGSMTNVTLTGNTAERGGGMFLDYSGVTMTNVTITGNEAYNGGGGMFLAFSSPTLTNVTLTGNEAYNGGGMYLASSSPTLTNVTLTGNEAYSGGGGMFLDYSSPVLTNVTLTGNEAFFGGGMDLHYSSPVLHSSVVAYNIAVSGGNLSFSTGDTLTSNSSAFYNPPSFGTDTLSPTGTYLTLEPMFLTYAMSDGTPCTPGSSTSCLPSDLHLALDSPLINAGDPALLDRDGSRSDIGSYGGPVGDAWDLDDDGLPDYFWPGTWDDAPKGFESTDYDCDDLDATVGGCP